MKIAQFIKQVFRDSLTTLILAVVSFVLILVITLNMTAAVLILILFIFLAVFQQSFSRGWLFLFLILLLLPSIRIGTEITIRDIFTVMLAIVGLVTITFENRRLPLNRLSFFFMLLVLVAGAFIAFGNFFGQAIDPNVWLLMITFALIWALLLTFQYLFQTQKRLKRFFLALAVVGVLHSIFGLLAYFFGFQTATGMGVTAGKFQHLIFQEANFQVNGFLGDGFVMRVGASALAPLLLVTIPISIGIFLTTSKTKVPKEKIVKPRKMRRFFDSIAAHSKDLKVVNLKKIAELPDEMPMLFSKRSLVFCLIAIQVLALLFTFSYEALIVLAIGLFVMGILLRNSFLLSIVASSLIILAVAFPGFRTSLVDASDQNIATWFAGFEQIKQSPWWGNGWHLVSGEGEATISTSQNIYNSYFFIWNRFGLIGLFVFLFALLQYFLEIRDAYLKSDDWPRRWLIVIMAIFVQLVLFGIMSNALIFGPAALVFWLFYGATQNLRKKIIQFGITETKLF